MTIIFPKNLTIDACEEVIKTIADSDAIDDLVLPVDTTKFAFGGLATAIQAVNTWGRKSINRKLILKESIKPEEERIAEVVNRPHQFSAAMLAKDISNSGDAKLVDLQEKIYLAAKSAIENQARSSFGQQRGPLCWFAFVDHSTKGFDRNFYIENRDSKPQPRNPEQIKSIIRAMVEKSLYTAGGGKPLVEQDVEHLGRMFLELFLNTHEHGSRGKARSEWLKPGIRIIYSNGINLSGKGVEGTWGEEPVLSNYLASQNVTSRFVEISIIDSGLGYCGRWQADHPESSEGGPLTLNDEYSIFRKCFTFRQTSSGKDNKGHGLPVVMERLTKLRGLMRIRSGRLALFRNFVENPYVHQDACDFTDWSSRLPASQNQTPMPFVNGVAITLLIPLEAKQ
ncbi:conserved hypothetical protein [Candidatus Nitrotoga sp. HW29]|uniref:hypothetical protein n=1 Tax=Candidatus Nitrotoga sp. HW29 TaxID=2886963 RepID=UPI001EF32696|nr:hypothetical protein [Candidatus Nitrotoga sp. HW29]CAH1906105.1 conserved hypothetical protein [Candidatus Nitrotoga sp. HW29]